MEHGTRAGKPPSVVPFARNILPPPRPTQTAPFARPGSPQVSLQDDFTFPSAYLKLVLLPAKRLRACRRSERVLAHRAS